jgi:hypothetical protein
MNLLYITQDNECDFLNVEPQEFISDYLEDIEPMARTFFSQNPGAEFYCICVVDFNKRESIIFEFQCENSISCTLY